MHLYCTHVSTTYCFLSVYYFLRGSHTTVALFLHLQFKPQAVLHSCVYYLLYSFVLICLLLVVSMLSTTLWILAVDVSTYFGFLLFSVVRCC